MNHFRQRGVGRPVGSSPRRLEVSAWYLPETTACHAGEQDEQKQSIDAGAIAAHPSCQQEKQEQLVYTSSTCTEQRHSSSPPRGISGSEPSVQYIIYTRT